MMEEMLPTEQAWIYLGVKRNQLYKLANEIGVSATKMPGNDKNSWWLISDLDKIRKHRIAKSLDKIM